jgi:transposase
MGRLTSAAIAGELATSQSRLVHSQRHAPRQTRRSALRHSRTLSVGLDVPQDASAVAEVAKDHAAAVISLGTIGPRQCASDHLRRTRQATATHLVCVEAAGPCGSWLHREFTRTGYDGWGVAPALLPQKPGDRVTTDRRDAVPLARLRRAGALTRVYGPPVADEASRDLPRARADTRRALTAAKCRLTACVRRQASRYGGRAEWTPAQHLVLHADVRAVNAHTERRQRLEHDRPEPVPSWRLPPVVDSLQARRGGQCPAAVTMVAASGARTRCDTPRERMKGLGLIPSASASGDQRRQGAIPQAANPHARRVLVAGAWAER